MLTIGFLQKCAECALLPSCSPGNINLLARFKSIAHALAPALQKSRFNGMRRAKVSSSEIRRTDALFISILRIAS